MAFAKQIVHAESKIEAELEFSVSPALLIIRKGLLKARCQYFTFISDEAPNYIHEYLAERVRRGETLDRETPIQGFDPRGSRKNSFLRTTLVARDVKKAINKAGFSWRPYV